MYNKKIKILIYLFSILLLFSCSSGKTALIKGDKNSSTNLRYDYKIIDKDGKKTFINKDFGDGNKDIVVFSTNDGLSSFNENLSIANIKHYVDHFDRENNFVAFVDTGNFSYGSEESKKSKGESSIEIMNLAKYDIIVPGSYEFNYGIDTFFKNMSELKSHVICCNIYDIKNKRLAFAPYVIYRFGNINVGFVGVTSPDAMFLRNNYENFFDKDGNQLVYLFDDENGKALYGQVQNAVDSCITNGADKVILLGHLGIEGINDTWSSISVIKNTKNIDAVIDGHSMEVLDNGLMVNKIGQFIPLVQAGSNYKYLGAINITREDYINQAVLKERSVNTKDEKFQEKVDEVLKKYQ